MSTVTAMRADRRNAFIGAFLGWVFDGYETFATVIVAAVVVNDLVGPGASKSHPLLIGAILAVTLISWAIGGLVTGVLADRFGRRKVLMYSILWYGICAGLTAISPNFALLLVFRFLTGIGMGAEWGGGSSLVAETARSKWRGFKIACLQGSFGIGFLLATGAWALLDHTDPSAWRWMYVFGIIPALATVFIRSKVRDSVDWKESDRRRAESAEAVSTGAVVTHAQRVLSRSAWSQLFSERVYAKRVFILTLGALGSLVGWWAVSTWIPVFSGGVVGGSVADPQLAISVILIAYNVAGIIGYLVMGIMADVLGRKPTMAIYFASSIVVTPLMFLLPSDFWSLLGLVALNGFFTLGQMTWIALYPGEQFPTRIRATGMSAVFNIARIPTAIMTLVASSLILVFGSISRAGIVIGCAAYLLCLIITPFMGRETRRIDLTEIDARDAEDLASMDHITEKSIEGA
jgi:MFS family permease